MPEDSKIPEDGVEFVLELAYQAPVPKKYHDTAELVLGQMQRTIETQSHKIAEQKERIEELESQIEE